MDIRSMLIMVDVVLLYVLNGFMILRSSKSGHCPMVTEMI